MFIKISFCLAVATLGCIFQQTVEAAVELNAEQMQNRLCTLDSQYCENSTEAPNVEVENDINPVEETRQLNDKNVNKQLESTQKKDLTQSQNQNQNQNQSLNQNQSRNQNQNQHQNQNFRQYQNHNLNQNKNQQQRANTNRKHPKELVCEIKLDSEDAGNDFDFDIYSFDGTSYKRINAINRPVLRRPNTVSNRIVRPGNNVRQGNTVRQINKVRQASKVRQGAQVRQGVQVRRGSGVNRNRRNRNGVQ